MSTPEAPDWSQYTHQELYAMTTTGLATLAAQAAEDNWVNTRVAITVIEQRLHEGLAAIGAGWEGTTAEAAAAGISPLGQWALTAVDRAEAMSTSLNLQGEYALHTMLHMPPPRHADLPPVAPDPGSARITDILAWEAADRERVNDEARARELMVTYQANSEANTPALAGWTAPPQVMVDPASAAGPGSGPGSGSGGLGTGAGGPGVGGAGVGGSGGTAGVGPGGAPPGGIGFGGIGPGGGGPGGIGPGGIGPGGTGPGGTGPGGTGPGAIGPGAIGPGAIGPGAIGPGAIGPGGIGPGRAGGVGPGGVGEAGIGRGGVGPATGSGGSGSGGAGGGSGSGVPGTGTGSGRSGLGADGNAATGTGRGTGGTTGPGGLPHGRGPGGTGSAPPRLFAPPSTPPAPSPPTSWRELVRSTGPTDPTAGRPTAGAGPRITEPGPRAVEQAPRPGEPRGGATAETARAATNRGSAAYGHPGMLPMGGAAATGQEHRRPAWLIDDSGVFDVEPYHVPPVLLPDDHPDRPPADRPGSDRPSLG